MENFTEKIPPIFTAPPIQFFVAIFLFIALLNDQRELTILSLIIMAVYWGTVIWSKAAGTGLESNSKVDRDRVFPDEFFSLDFNFVNNKLLPVLVYINIPLSRSLYLQENQGPPLKESRLLWYQKASFLWKIAAKKRGYYRIGHSDIKVGDLFSFCLRDLRIGDGIQIIVYPRLVTLKSFPLPKREFFGIPGGKSPVEDPAY
ncbi:MAG: hypothetical protein JW882_06390, partial [Deltaproteobacteria bacterium]|nr:hypothetical protein [Deltaproteobacteria bacterium]